MLFTGDRQECVFVRTCLTWYLDLLLRSLQNLRLKCGLR